MKTRAAFQLVLGLLLFSILALVPKYLMADEPNQKTLAFYSFVCDFDEHNIPKIEALLKDSEVDVNYVKKIGWNSSNALSCVADAPKNFQKQLIELILSRPDINPNVVLTARDPSYREFTALSKMIERYPVSELDAISVYLHHPKTDLSISHGNPLDTAIRYGKYEVVEQFAQIPNFDFNKERAIFRALYCESNCVQVIKTLLKISSLDPSLLDDNGNTVLHKAVQMEAPKEVIEALLEHPKIHVNLPDKYGRSVLFGARSYIIDFLLSQKETDLYSNIQGISPLLFLIGHGAFNEFGNLDGKEGEKSALKILANPRYDLLKEANPVDVLNAAILGTGEQLVEELLKNRDPRFSSLLNGPQNAFITSLRIACPYNTGTDQEKSFRIFKRILEDPRVDLHEPKCTENCFENYRRAPSYIAITEVCSRAYEAIVRSVRFVPSAEDETIFREGFLEAIEDWSLTYGFDDLKRLAKLYYHSPHFSPKDLFFYEFMKEREKTHQGAYLHDRNKMNGLLDEILQQNLPSFTSVTFHKLIQIIELPLLKKLEAKIPLPFGSTDDSYIDDINILMTPFIRREFKKETVLYLIDHPQVNINHTTREFKDTPLIEIVDHACSNPNDLDLLDKIMTSPRLTNICQKRSNGFDAKTTAEHFYCKEISRKRFFEHYNRLGRPCEG